MDLEDPNSMPASRVAQVRWRRQITPKWNILFALEEPKDDYTPLDSANALNPDLPELVFKPKYSFKNGHWANSFIYKPIIYTDKEYSFKKQLPSWGFTSSLGLKLSDKKTKIFFGLKKGDLIFSALLGMVPRVL